MSLTDDEKVLLRDLANDPDGLLRTKARPGRAIMALAEKHAIVNVLMTTLSTPGKQGGTSIWRITDVGRELISKASDNAD